MALLGEMADLAGFVVALRIDAYLLPDVVRLHHRHPWLFVADAKATESAGNRDTKTRILMYLRALRPWLEPGFTLSSQSAAGPIGPAAG